MLLKSHSRKLNSFNYHSLLFRSQEYAVLKIPALRELCHATISTFRETTKQLLEHLQTFGLRRKRSLELRVK